MPRSCVTLQHRPPTASRMPAKACRAEACVQQNMACVCSSIWCCCPRHPSDTPPPPTSTSSSTSTPAWLTPPLRLFSVSHIDLCVTHILPNSHIFFLCCHTPPHTPPAPQECKRSQVTYISPEHILLALLNMPEASGKRALDRWGCWVWVGGAGREGTGGKGHTEGGQAAVAAKWSPAAATSAAGGGNTAPSSSIQQQPVGCSFPPPPRPPPAATLPTYTHAHTTDTPQ